MLATDLTDVVTEETGKLHLDGTATGNDGVGLDGSKHNHDGVVEGTGGLLDVLGSSTSDHNSHSLCLVALSEHVVAFTTELNLLKLATGAKNVVLASVDGGLDDGAGGLADTLEILLGHATGTEDVSVCEVLGGQVTNGELGEHNVGTAGNNLVELVVDDSPLGVNNFLEIVGVLKSDLCAVFFGLKLKLEVEDNDLGVLEALGLLLETGVRESLAEADTLHKERISD